jgi:hypothetical protein
MHGNFVNMPYGLGVQGLQLRNVIFSSVTQPAKDSSVEKKIAAAKESTSVLRFEARIGATKKDCETSWHGIAAKESGRNAVGLNLPLIKTPGVSNPGDAALKVVEGSEIIKDLLSGKLKGVVKGAEMKLHVPASFAKDMLVTLAGVQSWLDSSRGLQFHVDAGDLVRDNGFLTLNLGREFDKDQASLFMELGAQPMQALQESFREVPALNKVHVTSNTFLRTCLKTAYDTRFGDKGSKLGTPTLLASEGIESYPKPLFDALYEPLQKQIAKCAASFLNMADFAVQFEAKAYTDLNGRPNPASLHFSIPLAMGTSQGDVGKEYFQGDVKIALTIATIETQNKA